MQQPAEHNKTYSAQDIERYHQGGMSEQEMHQLEKAALDDPFLADALDGYALTPTPAADALLLQQQLKEKIARRDKDRRKVLPLQWRVAALVVLLAGMGWIAYYLVSDNRGEVAIRQAEQPEPEYKPLPNMPAAPAAGDTITAAADETTATANTATEKQQNSPPPTVQGIAVSPTRAAPAAREEASRPSMDSIALSQASPDIFSEKKLNRVTADGQRSFVTFRGRVVDTNNIAIPYAQVVSKKSKAVTTTDNNGNFVLQAPDSTIEVAVNSAGYQSNATSLQPNAPANRIVLQPASGRLEEVVVTGYGTARQKSRQAPKVTVENAEPSEGWHSYDQYVAENLRSPEELGSLEGKGMVRLSFAISEDGRPTDIKVEKSLCAPCDAEAVRLLKEGPKWRRSGKNKRARAGVQF